MPDQAETSPKQLAIESIKKIVSGERQTGIYQNTDSLLKDSILYLGFKGMRKHNLSQLQQLDSLISSIDKPIDQEGSSLRHDIRLSIIKVDDEIDLCREIIKTIDHGKEKISHIQSEKTLPSDQEFDDRYMLWFKQLDNVFEQGISSEDLKQLSLEMFPE